MRPVQVHDKQAEFPFSEKGLMTVLGIHHPIYSVPRRRPHILRIVEILRAVLQQSFAFRIKGLLDRWRGVAFNQKSLAGVLVAVPLKPL
jgi:hypothetical protein